MKKQKIKVNKFPRSMTNVVRAMMASDPSGRASCMELLEFAWFQESLICSITDAQQVKYRLVVKSGVVLCFVG